MSAPARFDRELGDIGPTPAWDIVPRTEVESKVKFRWGNYPKALASLGGGDQPGRKRVTFWTYLGNSLTVAILGVLGTVVSNAIIAYGFARLKWPGRDWFFALTLATMMLPGPVLMVPLYSVFKAFGMIGTLLPLWLPAWFGSAFNIFLMRQFFRTIPEELSEAARIDGCSEVAHPPGGSSSPSARPSWSSWPSSTLSSPGMTSLGRSST